MHSLSAMITLKTLSLLLSQFYVYLPQIVKHQTSRRFVYSSSVLLTMGRKAGAGKYGVSRLDDAASWSELTQALPQQMVDSRSFAARQWAEITFETLLLWEI